MRVLAILASSCSLLLIATPAGAAQLELLTLAQAIEKSLRANPDLEAAAATTQEARERLVVARSGRLPRVEIVEGWQRGNQPVFVFGSLLNQRRFSDANFAVGELNRPDPLDNFHAAASLEQVVFDGHRTSAAIRAAEISVALSDASRRQSSADIAVAVAEAFGQSLVAEAAVRVSHAAAATASEDLSRTTARRDVGMATEADVLALTVHVAQVREREIATTSDAAIALATLNRLMSEPLDRVWQLQATPAPAATASPIDLLETEALRTRPDLARASLRVDEAQALHRIARAMRGPQVGVQASYEWNGNRFEDRTGSWLVGVQGRLSFSFGGEEAATSRAASYRLARSRAERVSAETQVRLDVRAATARLEAARAREAVGSSAVDQARESQRIVRDRYESGLANVTEVLRAADALLDAESLETAAQVDVVTAGVFLDRAVGRIAPVSRGSP
jgi:outer membrane protein